MYSLDTLNHTIRALHAGQQPPEDLIETGSKQFDTAWKVFAEDIKRGNVDVHSKWAAAGRATNETGSGVFPHNRVDQATRFVAGCYILCGYELAVPQRRQLPAGYSAPSPTDTITAHAVLMIETARNMSTYLEKQPIDMRTGQTLRRSIGEFYSLLMVALHEVRSSVGQPYHDAIDKGMELCERQCSRHGVTPAIPSGIALRIKQAKFQAGVDAVRDLLPDGSYPQQQQPQWQRMQSSPTSYAEQQADWRQLGSRIRPKRAPVSTDNSEGTVVHFDADAWRDKLKERAGKPKSDKPDFS